MKRFSLFLLISVILSFGASAQLLWKITPAGANARPSYIFGTNHIAPISIADRYDLNNVIANVDNVYGEISLKDLNPDPATAQEIAKQFALLAMAPADSTLDKLLSPSDMQKLDEALQFATGYNSPGMAESLNSLKPLAVSQVISKLLYPKAFPEFGNDDLLDANILKAAAAAGKEVNGLETIEQQINILFSIPLSLQAAALSESLTRPNYGLDDLLQLRDCYMAGDLDGLEKIINESVEANPAIVNEMVNKRNSEWVKFLLGILPTSSVLIVVGAGHLTGPTGLLNAFRSNGYTVEPIFPTE